jgi:hypothetical protein
MYSVEAPPAVSFYPRDKAGSRDGEPLARRATDVVFTGSGETWPDFFRSVQRRSGISAHNDTVDRHSYVVLYDNVIIILSGGECRRINIAANPVTYDFTLTPPLDTQSLL